MSDARTRFFASPREASGRLEWRESDNAVARAIFIASSLVTTSSCIGTFAGDHWWMGVISVLASLGVPVAVGLLAFRGSTAPSRLRVRINEDTRALEIEKGSRLTSVPHAQLSSAWIVAQRFVHVRFGERSLVLDLEDPESAQAFVAELGLDKEHRVLSMPTAGMVKTLAAQRLAALSLLPLSLVWSFSAILVAVMAGNIKNGAELAVVSMFASVLSVSLGGSIALVNDLRERKVVVGTDGVRVPHGKRPIRYDEIASVARSPSGVRIVKKDGAFVTLPLFRDGGFPFESMEDAQTALIARIEEHRTQGEKTHAEQKFALLDRAHASLAAWRAELLTIAAPRAGYRVAQLTAEDLERVISDSESDVRRRVAATVALSGLDRVRAKERVRVVAPTCADDGLKRALAYAAEEAAFDEAFMDEAAMDGTGPRAKHRA